MFYFEDISAFVLWIKNMNFNILGFSQLEMHNLKRSHFNVIRILGAAALRIFEL